MPGNSTSSNDTEGSGCPDDDKNEKRSSPFGWVHKVQDDTKSDVTPILAVVFPKRNSTIDPGWTDARFVCMQPAGSAGQSLGTRSITSSLAMSTTLALGIGLAAMF